MKSKLTIFVPEFVPLKNKGEEAIIRGYESMLRHAMPNVECQWGILGETENVVDHGNIRVFPRHWVENAMWPERGYKYKRMIWDVLYAYGHMRGRIKRVHSNQKVYSPLSDFWNTMDLMIVGHDGYFQTGCAVFLAEAKRCGLPAGILGCGFYPMKKGHWMEKIQRKIYKKTMELCDFAVFREEAPYKYMKDVGGKAHGDKARLMPDPAFVMEPVAKDEVVKELRNENWYSEVTESNANFIGVTVCQNDTHVVPFRAGKNWGGEMKSYWSYLAKILDRFVDETKCKLIFLPHCIEQGKNDDIQNARNVMEHMSEADSCHIMSGDYSARFMKGVIGELDFLIGQRTHSLIGSIGVNTPSVGLTSSGDRRTHEILGGFCNYEPHLIDVDILNLEEATTILLDSYNNRDDIKSKQRSSYKEIQSQLYGVAGQIAAKT